jgi:uncharacterized protein GlcG (DUF336 family)
MDGAAAWSAEIAINKAYTATAFHVATSELAAQARRPWFRSLVISQRGRILPEGGAISIIEGVAIIGAIGVAGTGKAEQDILCCQAALGVFDE